MMRALVSPHLPSPSGPYSHIVEANGIVFTAGLGPQDPATGRIPEDIRDQTAAVIDNLARALNAVDLTLGDVAKTTVHLHDLQRDFAAYNDVYQRRFPEPYPVRTTVGSSLYGILVEIDAIAIRPHAPA